MKTFQPTVYEDTDHVEHWNHPKPPPGEPCPAGTEHLHTFTDRYTLGGMFGIMAASRLCRGRLADLLSIRVEDIQHSGIEFGGELAGFVFTIPEISPHGFARVTYDPKHLWTYCLVNHPHLKWWYRGCKHAVDLPEAPAAEVMRVAAEAIRRTVPRDA